MDPFAIVVLGVLAALVLCVWLLGLVSQDAGGEHVGLRSARQITERREALDAEDLEQMLAATNARRAARGLPERTLADAERDFGSAG